MNMPSSDIELYLFTGKKVKNIKRPYNPSGFTKLQVFILNVKM